MATEQKKIVVVEEKGEISKETARQLARLIVGYIRQNPEITEDMQNDCD